MKKSQLNAISYAYYERMRKQQEKYIKEHNLIEDFKKSKYKTMSRYLRFVCKVCVDVNGNVYSVK